MKQGRAHITWCTTGQLAFLPLHAAGPYDGESPSAVDLVVSSYTPNLSCLLPSATLIEATAPPSIFVVAQPKTPGVSPLPGTVQESKKVAANFPTNSAKVLLGQDGTIEAVLEHMAKHPYVHLACHGKQDADPTKSAFLLHDGPLTLHTLMAHKSSNAQLAFLSACETATGDEKVPNEAVHLAAGMLAAGYKSVVATMWSIGDTEAPRVADEFYKALLADPEHNVAFALHDALKKLREHVGVDNFVKWMPYIHLGL
ncbi:hypothetical protein EXIGLDRAFT_607963 [Exidia glandulosa HHB12029]|uniref:CHAT domain-containing protein n=1 Tax=Exidia glandulosa HHB12029 TaxID=1314781 RepID=A0A165L8P4_EXIGL|nr:hypothetical protein EXIGLDRAFT_607963 [Exidia glandulosa HHB12029]